MLVGASVEEDDCPRRITLESEFLEIVPVVYPWIVQAELFRYVVGIPSSIDEAKANPEDASTLQADDREADDCKRDRGAPGGIFRHQRVVDGCLVETVGLLVNERVRYLFLRLCLNVFQNSHSCLKVLDLFQEA